MERNGDQVNNRRYENASVEEILQIRKNMLDLITICDAILESRGVRIPLECGGIVAVDPERVKGDK